MIRYTLKCGCGHGFESWFPSSSSYEEQRGRGLVTCPRCASSAVEKAVMAPSVARTDRAAPRALPPAPAETAPPACLTADAPQPAAAPAAEMPGEATSRLALMGPPDGELRALLRKVREHVMANADYVGKDFADLARKMHQGDEEHRPIYGEATREEVEALKEDEVEVLPLPVLPEEHN